MAKKRVKARVLTFTETTTKTYEWSTDAETEDVALEQNTKSSIIITELLDIIQSQSEALESCGCFCGSFDFDKLACISCSALSETNTRLQKLRGGG